jgi:PPOX class probable FMN-dependent enzyme
MSDSVASVAQSAQLAPWRSVLSRALHRNRSKPYSRYFQLATIHLNHRPANRTVVFRGFLPDTNALMFITDSRSQKVEDVAAYPVAEACWYFTETREQFRLAGNLLLVDAHQPDSALRQARQQVWEKLSDKSRLQFYWPDPGQPRTADADRFTSPTPDDSHPPDVFYLGVLSPERVDHLELRGDPQNRNRYIKQKADDWHHIDVNP